MELLEALRRAATADFANASDRRLFAKFAENYMLKIDDGPLSNAASNFTDLVKEASNRLQDLSMPGVQAEIFTDVISSWNDVWRLISDDQDARDESACGRMRSAFFMTIAASTVIADRNIDLAIDQSTVDDLETDLASCLEKRYIQQTAFVYLRSRRKLSKMTIESALKSRLYELLERLAKNEGAANGHFTLRIDETPAFRIVRALDASAIRNFTPIGVNSFRRLKERMMVDNDLQSIIAGVFGLTLDAENALVSAMLRLLVDSSKRSIYKYVISKAHKKRDKNSSLSFRTKVLIPKSSGLM